MPFLKPSGIKGKEKCIFGVLFPLLIITAPLIANPALAVTDYMLYNSYGGTWCDAEKTSDNSQDDLMCWAAVTFNVLQWTGWGNTGGMTNSDQIFSYYQDHWTNTGGIMEFAWEWWFSGYNYSQGWDGWSQVDVPGGNFHPNKDFWDYYHREYIDSAAMSAIDSYLHNGYGTALALYTASGGGHAITVWGYQYGSNPADYLGIWVSDSDDNKNGPAPRPDSLKYYNVAYSGSKWYLQDFYGTNNTWYIGEVQGLAPVPEPATVILLSLGFKPPAPKKNRIFNHALKNEP